MPTTDQPIRCFQRYTSEERAGKMASHRQGFRQREAVGEFFWIHPALPGVAFSTRRAAIAAAIEAQCCHPAVLPSASEKKSSVIPH